MSKYSDLRLYLEVPSSDYLDGAEEEVDGEVLDVDATLELFREEQERLLEEHFEGATVAVEFTEGYGRPSLTVDTSDEKLMQEVEEDYERGFLPRPEFSEERLWVYRSPEEVGND